MSQVNVSALIGFAPRYREGVEPFAIALMHEGAFAAFRLGLVGGVT